MAAIPRADGAWNVGAHLGLSDSDAQVLYFVASLLLTGVLVIVTISYAVQNRRMVQEMRWQNELAIRPIVVASIAEAPVVGTTLAAGQLTIRNVGMGSALFVRLDNVVINALTDRDDML